MSRNAIYSKVENMELKGKTIFIVEDNLHNRAVMLTILQHAGATTHFDMWGRQTLERIKRACPVDLIFMDLMLPHGVTGYDVFEQLQTDAEVAQIPVVVVSASDPSVEMKKARDMGFQGFISKPINYASFAHSIAKLIEGEQVWNDDFVE